MTTQSSSRKTSPPHRIDEATLTAALAASPVVLVKFSGAWCAPCRALQPTLEAIARDRGDVAVLEVDVDESQAVAQRFEIRSVPTVVAFRDGQPIGRLVGNQPRARVEALLRA